MSETWSTTGPHTGEEWYLRGDEMVVCSNDGATICVGRCNNDVELARFRLIAEAPKLLEALKRAVAWIEREESTHGRTFGVGNECRAAIKKATGEQ